jgi:hypothetical protein
MMTTTQTLDEIFHYQGFFRPSHCRVRFYDREHLIVILSDVENGGTTAVNAIESVITGITKKYNLCPKSTQFYHYDSVDVSCTHTETFDRVLYTWNGREYEQNSGGYGWNRVTRQSVETLIGCQFD